MEFCSLISLSDELLLEVCSEAALTALCDAPMGAESGTVPQQGCSLSPPESSHLVSMLGHHEVDNQMGKKTGQMVGLREL